MDGLMIGYWILSVSWLVAFVWYIEHGQYTYHEKVKEVTGIKKIVFKTFEFWFATWFLFIILGGIIYGS